MPGSAAAILLASTVQLLPDRAADYAADLDALVARLEATHPEFAARCPPSTFAPAVATLRDRLSSLSDAAYALELGALVGKRVTRLGARTIEPLLEEARAAVSGDNDAMRDAFVPLTLIVRDALPRGRSDAIDRAGDRTPTILRPPSRRRLRTLAEELGHARLAAGSVGPSDLRSCGLALACPGAVDAGAQGAPSRREGCRPSGRREAPQAPRLPRPKLPTPRLNRAAGKVTMGRVMRDRMPLLRLPTRLGRAVALLAWLAMAAQAFGVPIHLAVEEHASHEDHGLRDDHSRFGRFDHHGTHHHAHHADAIHADHHGDCRHEPQREGAPCQDGDAPALPPHSALDHLIGTIAARASTASLLSPFLANGSIDVTLPPRADRGVLGRASERAAPEKPPPRRPERSRAPPVGR